MRQAQRQGQFTIHCWLQNVLQDYGISPPGNYDVAQIQSALENELGGDAYLHCQGTNILIEVALPRYIIQYGQTRCTLLSALLLSSTSMSNQKHIPFSYTRHYQDMAKALVLEQSLIRPSSQPYALQQDCAQFTLLFCRYMSAIIRGWRGSPVPGRELVERILLFSIYCPVVKSYP